MGVDAIVRPSTGSSEGGPRPPHPPLGFHASTRSSLSLSSSTLCASDPLWMARVVDGWLWPTVVAASSPSTPSPSLAHCRRRHTHPLARPMVLASADFASLIGALVVFQYADLCQDVSVSLGSDLHVRIGRLRSSHFPALPSHPLRKLTTAPSSPHSPPSRSCPHLPRSFQPLVCTLL